MKQYRIKTEQELIEEFGEDWRDQLDWWMPGMDHYFGLQCHEYDGQSNLWMIGSYFFKYYAITDKPLPITKLPEEYCVEVKSSSEEAKELAKWLNNKYQTELVGAFNYYGIFCDGVDIWSDKSNIPIGLTVIPFQTWEKLINMEKKNKKVVGYKLIKKYPGVFGDMGKIYEANTLGADIAKEWPEFWEPIYEQEKEIVTLRYEGGTFELEVSKDGVFWGSQQNEFDYQKIYNFLYSSAFIEHEEGDYHLTISHVNIGCKNNIPIQDIRKVLDVYKKLKK